MPSCDGTPRRAHSEPRSRPVAQEGLDVEVVVDLELPQRRAVARALGLPVARGRLALEPGRDHGHPQLVAERLVDGGAEDDVGGAGSGLAYGLSRLRDLLQREL